MKSKRKRYQMIEKDWQLATLVAYHNAGLLTSETLLAWAKKHYFDD